MTTRSMLAEQLKPLLPKNFNVIDHPTEVEKITAKTKACLMLVRKIVKPADTQGSFRETFELWLIVPQTDTDGVAENTLDDSLDDTIAALQGLAWLKWDQATRLKFNDLYPAFRIDLTVNSKQREEAP